MRRRPRAHEVRAALKFYEQLSPKAQAHGAEAEGGRRETKDKSELPHTWTETWRHECEVRFVKALHAERREAYLNGVAEHRGAAAAKRLREDAWALMQKTQRAEA